MGQSYEQYSLSQQFKDQSIENDYIEHIQKSIIKLGPVTLFQVLFGVLVIFSMSLYKLIINDGKNPNFYTLLYMYGSSFILMLIHYYLTRKYKWAANIFSAVQSINSLVTANEMVWLTFPSINDVDGEAAQAACLASLAMMSYNQTTQLFTYMVMFAYYALRNYSEIPVFSRYLRVISYGLLFNMFLYFYARAWNQRDRENFKINRKQR